MKKYLLSILGMVTVLLPTTIFAVTYSTLDPLNASPNIVLSNGDLTATSASGEWDSVISTISKDSGKWYFEMTFDSSTAGGAMVCLADITVDLTTFIGASSPAGRCLSAGGTTYYAGTGSYGGGSFADGNILGFAWDANNGFVTIYKNGLNQGTWSTDAFLGTQSNVLYAGTSVQNGATVTFNFGATPFAETVPTGYCEGLSDTCVGGGGGGEEATTTTASTTPYAGPGIEEWLLISCIGLYFISLWGWGHIFSPLSHIS